jgi:hypothetical protein
MGLCLRGFLIVKVLSYVAQRSLGILLTALCGSWLQFCNRNHGLVVAVRDVAHSAAALPTGGKERQKLCLPFGCVMRWKPSLIFYIIISGYKKTLNVYKRKTQRIGQI